MISGNLTRPMLLQRGKKAQKHRALMAVQERDYHQADATIDGLALLACELPMWLTDGQRRLLRLIAAQLQERAG